VGSLEVFQEFRCSVCSTGLWPMSPIFFETPSCFVIRADSCEKQQACFVTLNLEPEDLTGFVQIEDVSIGLEYVQKWKPFTLQHRVNFS